MVSDHAMVLAEVAMHERELAEEHEASQRFDRLATELAAAVAAYPYLWRWGDGMGGHVMVTIDRALVAAGFDSRPPAPIRRSQQVVLLAKRDGWDCHYCGDPLGWGHPSVTTPVVEHVVPKVQYGSDDLDNLVLACTTCNGQKAGRTPTQWLGFACCEAHG